MDKNKSAAERSKEWYEANREKALETRKNYNAKNKEEVSAYQKEWYEKNKLAQKAKRKENYEKNKEKEKERMRLYKLNNPDKVKESHKKWREENKDKVREKQHNYRARKANAFIETVKFSVVFKRDKGVCYICKNKVTTELPEDKIIPKDYGVLDHVVPLNKGGLHCYDNIKLACHGCNSAKSDHIPEEGIQMNLFAQPGAIVQQPKETEEERKARKAAYNKKYKAENAERIKQQEKAKREANRPEDYEPRIKFAHLPKEERQKIYYERYRAKSRDEINERERKRKAERKAKGLPSYKPSKEKEIEYSRKYRENNREAINERRRLNRAKKKEQSN